MPRPTISEGIGFVSALIGISGLAGWTESGRGLILSLALLGIGIVLLYKDGVWHQ